MPQVVSTSCKQTDFEHHCESALCLKCKMVRIPENSGYPGCSTHAPPMGTCAFVALLRQIMVHTLPNLCDKLGSELDNCANTFQLDVFSSNCLFGLSVVGRSSASGVSGQLHTVASCQAPGDPSHCTTASDNSWPKAYQHVPSYQSHPSFGHARIKSSLIISKHCHILLEQLQYPTSGE